MLVGGDTDGGLTAVAVGIAKLGEPAVMSGRREAASSFIGTGRALSVAAGRLSYTHNLKVCAVMFDSVLQVPHPLEPTCISTCRAPA